ncbi:WD40-repeat-containing domain protein [Cladochytrium replicatum]|nr:WD40-repeat-containing domain protein [Cladochytrium replicatum]
MSTDNEFPILLPYVSAIHPCSIYSLTATQNMKWIFTGGDDGFIRKWDFVASMNGDTSLTQNQRHGLPDTITKAGVLVSAWETEEVPDPSLSIAKLQTPESILDPSAPVADPAQTAKPPQTTQQPKISPVFSMDVQSEGIWLLTGLENGSVNLYTVRHEEGHCHHTLRGHTKAVSVLKITPNERGVVTGSWDKTLKEWDLDNGEVARSYPGPTSQITSVSFQPSSVSSLGQSVRDVDDMDVDSDMDLAPGRDQNLMAATSFDGASWFFDRRQPEHAFKIVSEVAPPWALSGSWSPTGDRIYFGRRNGTVEEWDVRERRMMRAIKMPRDSGSVSYVLCLPNDRHLLCASFDNIRLWDLGHHTTAQPSGASTKVLGTPMPGTPARGLASSLATLPNKSNLTLGQGLSEDPFAPVVVPFTIVPGHHGGVISNILLDKSQQYLVSASGSRGWDGTSTNNCLFYEVLSDNY